MEPGQVLAGRYELEREVGSGGAAIVWRARDRTLGRTIAVKLLHPSLERDEDTVARFQREARSAATLNHPNAVAIYDIGSDEGETFIVMEYVDGPGLDEVFGGGALPAEVVVAVGYQVATALGAAHERGLIHRDIKPANILLTRDGHAKVADFGIAKAIDGEDATLTRAGTVVGTVAYLAPEQIRGESVDARADVYGLGLVLHEALSGQPPFGTGTPAELTARRLASDPPSLDEIRPELPEELVHVITRATKLEPEQRFEDGAELALSLERLLEDEPQVLVQRLARQGHRAPRADETAILPRHRSDDETLAVDVDEQTPGRVPDVIPEREGQHDDRDPIVPPDARAPIVAVLVLVGLVLGAFSLLGGDDESQDGGNGRDEPTAVEVRAARDFDPFGDDGEEHADEVGNAHDGDPGTAWRTSRYDSADLGGLKPGVGIWFDLGASHDLSRVELTLSPGIDLTVLVGDDQPSGDPGGWGQEVGSIEGASDTASIEVPEDVTARYVLLWVTSVGGSGGRAEIAEVRFLAR